MKKWVTVLLLSCCPFAAFALECAPLSEGDACRTDDRQSIIFTPMIGFCGRAEFYYTVTDGMAEDSAKVTVDVICDNNRAPTANDDSFNIPKSGESRLSVLANDSDPEGDALTIDSTTVPAKGTLIVDSATQEIIYVPGKHFRGEDNFQYTITDGEFTDTATVTVKAIKGRGKP